MALKSYRELEVWQRAVDLVEAVYQVTRAWPDAERYGLTSQAQRAAISIPANIAEGYGRSHRGDYLHHLSIARGSLMELETHLIVAHRLKYISKPGATALWKQCQRVGQLLNRHLAAIERLAHEEAGRSPRSRRVPGTRNPEPGTPRAGAAVSLSRGTSA